MGLIPFYLPLPDIMASWRGTLDVTSNVWSIKENVNDRHTLVKAMGVTSPWFMAGWPSKEQIPAGVDAVMTVLQDETGYTLIPRSDSLLNTGFDLSKQ